MGMCRCPYNEVASFVYRYSKGNRDIEILEVGSGDGNNLWYLTKEGFNIRGIEISQERINNARMRLREDNLEVEIKQGSFTEIEYEDNMFDLVIDRGAITCVNYDEAKKAISEIHRVLNKDGYLIIRVNSSNDIYTKPGKEKEIEEEFYFDGDIYKKYYNEEELRKLFKNFTIYYIEEKKMDRYKKPKILWELCLRKK